MEAIMTYKQFYPFAVLCMLIAGPLAATEASFDPSMGTQKAAEKLAEAATAIGAIQFNDIAKTCFSWACQNKLFVAGVGAYALYRWSTNTSARTIDNKHVAPTLATVLNAAMKAETDQDRYAILKGVSHLIYPLTKKSYFTMYDWAVSTDWLPWQKGPLFKRVPELLSSRVQVRNAALEIIKILECSSNNAISKDLIEVILDNTVQHPV